jgi:pantothenate synthetase
MRPSGATTTIDPGPIAALGDGVASNLAHATMAARLLGMLRPCATYAGELDLVRLRILERIAADLHLPGAIVPCPVARDADGLPWATANARLTLGQRRTAAALPRALMLLRDMAATGERSCAALLAEAIALLGREPSLEVETLAIVDGRTLAPREELQPGDYALARIRVGGIPLHDVLQLLAPVD